MIKHIVMLKLKDPSTENIELAKNKLLGMRGKIDILKNIEVGVDFIGSERSMDLILITDFDSREDLQAYAGHPLHVPVLSVLKELCEYTKAVDYEY